MRASLFFVMTLLGTAAVVAGCSHAPGGKKTAANVTRIEAGPDAQKRRKPR